MLDLILEFQSFNNSDVQDIPDLQLLHHNPHLSAFDSFQLVSQSVV